MDPRRKPPGPAGLAGVGLLWSNSQLPLRHWAQGFLSWGKEPSITHGLKWDLLPKFCTCQDCSQKKAARISGCGWPWFLRSPGHFSAAPQATGGQAFLPVEKGCPLLPGAHGWTLDSSSYSCDGLRAVLRWTLTDQRVCLGLPGGCFHDSMVPGVISWGKEPFFLSRCP